MLNYSFNKIFDNFEIRTKVQKISKILFVTILSKDSKQYKSNEIMNYNKSYSRKMDSRSLMEGSNMIRTTCPLEDRD